MNLQDALQILVTGEPLAQAQATAVFDLILTGEATPAQIGSILTALATRGETAAEIAGAAAAMRAVSTKVEVDVPNLVDTCGTGGSGGAKRFNISTAAAFVAAAAGAHVAKHGNRGMTSKSGSADVLEAAGVQLEITPEQVGRCISEVGVGFLFAVAHHPAMRFAGPVRRELGFRTIFNLLGPLTNPAGAKRQVIGVFSPDWQRPLADVLHLLGAEHVLIVHSDGLDELSIHAPSTIVELLEGTIETREVAPSDFGIDQRATGDLAASSPEESLALVRAALTGRNEAAADIVALNAGAAIYASGVATSMANGVTLAQDLISTGLANERLKELVDVTQADGRIGVTSSTTPDILRRILQHKRAEVDARKADCPVATLRAKLEQQPPPRGFRQALIDKAAAGSPAVIAEIKRASPSEGVIREPFDPPAIAASYAGAGATCLSVLTDERFFQGNDSFLPAAREASGLPALRKDFIVDPWQVPESRALGADCVLLIAAALSDGELTDCHALAIELGMDALVEVHDRAELDRALSLNAPLIGINNRNLNTFETRLETTLELCDHVPPHVTLVTESGIHSREDIALMRRVEVHAFLVGTAFMREDDPGRAFSRLFGD